MLPLTAVTSTAAAAAMLDPTRFAILEGLKAPGSAASVAAQLGAPRQRIWYHIRELERARTWGRDLRMAVDPAGARLAS